MPKTLTILNDNRIERLDQGIRGIREGLLPPSALQQMVQHQPGEQVLYHYTSLEKLFAMLSTDSMWASFSLFSNDSSEGKTLGNEWLQQKQYQGDNFILCFCDRDDILSQWRGYCPGGGASIGFWFPAQYGIYTLLHADYQDGTPMVGSAIESCRNRPLPVIYCASDNAAGDSVGVDVRENLLGQFDDLNVPVSLEEVVPYLKNGRFAEERELRIVFSNTDRSLDRCIRFRRLSDGSMVPYIVVKWGDQLEMGKKLALSYPDEKIEQIFNENIRSRHRKTVVLPCGQDQDKVCDKLTHSIQEYKKGIYGDDKQKASQKRWQLRPAKIICDGHLPVVSITVAPSPDQAHTKEVIERFCRSRYWLQNAVVKCSEIPYVASKL